jgi:predicted transposase/invertase (TIGR01784 family)
MDTDVNAEVYLNPRTDFGFKKIFFDRELLIDFLNEIIGEKARITDVEYLPNEILGEWDTDRKAVFDLYCRNSEGEYFIVEMQKAQQVNIAERSMFYTACSIRNQAPKGKWDYKLKAVYLVAVLDFVAFKEKEVRDEYIEQVYLYRQQAKKKLSDKLDMIFIELPKFTKQLEDLTTNTDRWLYILKNLEKLTSRPAEVQGKVFKRLFELAEIKRLTEEDMEAYKTSILEYDSIKTAIRLERMDGLEEGIGIGVEKGIGIGVERGIGIGVEKGKKIERQDLIKRLIRGGISIELVQSILNLPPNEIEDISEN